MPSRSCSILISNNDQTIFYFAIQVMLFPGKFIIMTELSHSKTETQISWIKQSDYRVEKVIKSHMRNKQKETISSNG